MKRRRIALLASLTAICLAASCQPGAQGPATVAVTGIVTQGGSPVEGALVLFHPAAKGQGLKTSNGETDAEGKFELQSHVEGAEYKSGAQVGEYLVTVEKTDRSQVFKSMAPPKNMLPVKYRSPKTSGFTATVSTDGDNHFEFDVQ